jgi:hypothetical protein
MPDRDVLSVLSDTDYANLNAFITRAWTKQPLERQTAKELYDFCTLLHNAYPGGDAPLQKRDKGYHGRRMKLAKIAKSIRLSHNRIVHERRPRNDRRRKRPIACCEYSE